MGNPCRYFFENKFIIRRPEIDEDKKQVKILAAWTNFANHKYGHPGFDNEFKSHYDQAFVDFYSAPDVIMTYSNGNTCKDEWCRYGRTIFKNLNLVKIEEPLVEDDWAVGVFSFDEITHEFNQEDMEIGVPMGKFYGMTKKDVENYKRKNYYKFKGWKPKASKEALDAAWAAQPTPHSLVREDVEKMVLAAYEVDM